MIVVIIAGGSGTRLWPLSTDLNPKQLLKLTGERSMVQQAYDRASKISNNIYVVPDTSHAEKLKAQLPELNEESFVVEPGRRGTAHCILAALRHVAKRHDHDEPVAFIHGDHHVRDVSGFLQSFKQASEVSKKQKTITLVGVDPTYPATGFGYIKRGKSEENGVYKVESFKEKPDYDVAVEYLSSGEYVWNCGYFVGSVNVFVNTMKEYSKDLYQKYNMLYEIEDTNEFSKKYLELDEQVIDVALIEKAKNLSVVSAQFDWMDVGNFKDLHDANLVDKKGNHVEGKNIYCDDIETAYVRNEEDKPIALIGLDNVVVVNTPDGLLVARKDVSHKVGAIAKQIKAKNAKK